MAITIDQLNIELTANSKDAISALDDLAKSIEKVKNSLGPLAKVTVKINNSLGNQTKSTKSVSVAMQDYANKTNQASKSAKSFTDRLAQKISKTRTLVGAFKSAADTMASWFNESNEYIETLNLFNVTMGDGAKEARNFAENVSDLMGIDPKEWMQYQGIFKNLTAGFGVASDKADIMSKNLTQLSYDLSSFFNTDVETAFDKLSSAMSGQVKGLREFGIDTTVASLQEYALAQGIDASVRSMSQAEKSLLRYNYIMEKSIIMQGDMARTIITPANSLRILNAQLTQMKRALGNVISVLVVQFIPYVQAMVEIVADAANALAKLFGFELPEIDYSSLGSGFEDAEESLDGVSGKVKKIKKQLMGFDELNIINNPESDSGGSGSTSGGSAGLNIDPIEYDFLKGLKTDKLDEIKKKFKEILKVVKPLALAVGGIFAVASITKWVGAIGVALTAIKSLAIIDTFLNGFLLIKTMGGTFLQSFAGGISAISYSLSTAQKAFLGITTAITLALVVFTTIKDLTYSIATGTETLGQIIGTVIGVVVALTAAFVAFSIVFNSTGIGLIITLLVGAVAGLIGLASGLAKAGEEAYKSSEDFLIMQSSIETTTAIADRCAESISSMKSAVESLDEVSANYALAKNLTNEIFDLNEKANLSQYELAQIKTKVEVLNGLNIDGLHLAIDETTGRVIQTRQETEKLIEALEKEAQMEALRDVLVEAYKAQYRAMTDNTTASKEYEMAASAVEKTQKQLGDTVWYEFEKRAELKAQLEKQTEAMESAQTAMEESKKVYDDATFTIEDVTKKYANLASGQEDVVETTRKAAEEIGKAASGANTNAANVVSGATKGIKDNSKQYTGAVKDMATSGNDEFAKAIDSHSPAKVYIGFAANIISGLVSGIDKNKQSILNKMSSLATEMGNAFEKAFSLKNISLSVSFSTWVSSDKKKVYEALGLSGWPQLKWYTYANGGFPTVGEMFIARERGPELVGSIGNKTAVANNDQIVSGIESGVYRAMMAANSTNRGGSQTIRIINEIDGDVVGEKVIQYHNGKVMQTGTSPLLV